MIKETFYTVSEAAEKLGVSDRRVRQLCKELEVSEPRGRDWILTERDLEEMAKRPDRRKSSG